MNLAYQLFHLDGVSPERDANAKEVRASLTIPDLASPTLSFADVPNTFAFPQHFKTGETGLWYSTYVALENFLKSPHDALLILEDDILLEKGFLAGAQEYLSRVPFMWDFFYQYVHPWQGEHNYRDEHSLGDTKVCRSYQVWSNACFWVSRAGAQKLLDALNGYMIEDAIDWHILKRGMTREWAVYTLKPGVEMFCNIAGFKTTIQEQS
jgi:GR25 family glycosyltransferase involved in LPS biosynthesis